MPSFPPAVVSAVLEHMNNDHVADSLLIVRAYAESTAYSAVMTDLDGEGGVWTVSSPQGSREVRIPWAGPISERAEIRRAVVVLYREACRMLGVEPRTE